jgi:hypothetical protein
VLADLKVLFIVLLDRMVFCRLSLESPVVSSCCQKCRPTDDGVRLLEQLARAVN